MRTKGQRSDSDAERYLLSRGWLRKGVYPWEWSQPTLPAAHYVLDDAVALQRIADRNNNVLVHAKKPKS